MSTLTTTLWCICRHKVNYQSNKRAGLVYLQTQSELFKQQTPWSEYLQMFSYKWQHRPGKSSVANPLSRSPGVDLSTSLPVERSLNSWQVQSSASPGCWPSRGLKQVMVHRSVSHFYRRGGVLCCDYTQSGKSASSLCCACAQALECHSHTGIWTC